MPRGPTCVLESRTSALPTERCRAFSGAAAAHDTDEDGEFRDRATRLEPCGVLAHELEKPRVAAAATPNAPPIADAQLHRCTAIGRVGHGTAQREYAAWLHWCGAVGGRALTESSAGGSEADGHSGRRRSRSSMARTRRPHGTRASAIRLCSPAEAAVASRGRGCRSMADCAAAYCRISTSMTTQSVHRRA